MSTRPDHVIGPVGERLTVETLPAGNPRWTARRKAEVAAAVRGGLLTFEEACARYSLSMEELINWQRAEQRSGMRGLRVTRLLEYRELYEKQDGYTRADSSPVYFTPPRHWNQPVYIEPTGTLARCLAESALGRPNK